MPSSLVVARPHITGNFWNPQHPVRCKTRTTKRHPPDGPGGRQGMRESQKQCFTDHGFISTVHAKEAGFHAVTSAAAHRNEPLCVHGAVSMDWEPQLVFPTLNLNCNRARGTAPRQNKNPTRLLTVLAHATKTITHQCSNAAAPYKEVNPAAYISSNNTACHQAIGVQQCCYYRWRTLSKSVAALNHGQNAPKKSFWLARAFPGGW